MRTPPRSEKATDLPAPQVRTQTAGPDQAPTEPGYLSKSDWLRAQFLPEVEVLDFRGLLVGNKGLWILEDWRTARHHPVDPNRIADLLHRGHAHRESGDCVKALMCYQELVELDPQNTDFRFLLELAYQAIAVGVGAK